jgi:hypothetical protein
MCARSDLHARKYRPIGAGSLKSLVSAVQRVKKEGTMSKKTYMIALGFAGVLSFGWLGASHVAAFPTDAAAIKAAAPVSVIDVRGGRGGGGFRGGGGRVAGGGFRGGGGRYAGGGFRGGGGRYAGGGIRGDGGRYAGGGRWAAGGRYAGGGRWAAGGYRGGYYGGGYRPYWGAAAAGAAVGAAAAGAASYYNQPYYYGQQCGYYPYPPCY